MEGTGKGRNQISQKLFLFFYFSLQTSGEREQVTSESSAHHTVAEEQEFIFKRHKLKLGMNSGKASSSGESEAGSSVF